MKHLLQPLPQECKQKGLKTELIEVFRLGFIFYFLLSLSDDDEQALQNPPVLPLSVATSKDPAILALRSAMESAFTVEEKKRPKAREIGDFLSKEVSKIERQDHKNDSD